MKLQDQVTSLDLSKQLKELGYPQVELFWWVCYDGKWVVEKHHGWSEAYKHADEQVYCAPTVAEMGEAMQLDKVLDGKIIVEKGTASKDWYVSMEAGGGGVQFQSHTEANARAKCLIYLLENNLISL